MLGTEVLVFEVLGSENVNINAQLMSNIKSKSSSILMHCVCCYCPASQE